ncbi:MAG TPA: hypothetical protein VFM35_04715 [Candidatus Binatia bacterium]|nr:hypothetical protein [Candidatus Binatia bacterium]
MEIPETPESTETARQELEAPLAPELVEIHFDKETFQAAICPRCGGKIYPQHLLDAHLDRHQVKDLFVVGELRKLQAVMGRLR